MTSIGYGRVGKPVRLYDGFLQKRQVVERRLREAGLGDGDISRWAADAPGLGTSLDVNLQECGVDGEQHEQLLMEAGSTSDFGAYLSDKATKRLMAGYEEAPSSWRQYTRTYSVPDFKPISFVRLTEMDDLLEIPEGGPYTDSSLGEIPGPEVTVATFGRLFSLSRKAIINDDLNQLRDRPAGLGRSTARTMSKAVVKKLTDNPTSYDGNATFSVAHNNLTSGVLSEQKIADMTTRLRRQTDDNGNELTLRPQAGIIPPELEWVMERIRQSAAVPMAGYGATTPAAPPQHGFGGANVVANIVRDVIVETYLKDIDDFYLMANPNDAPGLVIGFLNGKQEPDIFLKDPGMRNVLGTSDPYSMEYDEIVWKTRHDWGTAILDWRGLQKSAN